MIPGVMTPAEVWAVLRRMKYKPGWQFIIDTSPLSDDWEVIVRGKVQCVDTGEPTTVTFRRTTTLEFFSEDEVVRFIRSIIRDLEEHEVKEWLKVDGVQFENPHPEMARTL